MDSIADYQQVTFIRIPETFPLDSDVECAFTRVSTFVTSRNDWIGLYKVGWTSSREHLTYEWVSSALQNSTNEHRVIFKVSILPKDDGEFYQFCYVTGSGQVRGVSSPFQFKMPQAEDFVEIEDLDDDIMIIKSRTSALQDELVKVLQDQNSLAKKNEKLEKEYSQLKLQYQELQQDYMDEMQLKEKNQTIIQAKEMELTTLQQDFKNSHKILEELRNKVLQVKEEKASIARQLEDKETYIRSLQEKIKSLVSEKDQLAGKTRMLEEEKDLYKENFASSESTVSAYVKEIDDLRKQLATAEENNEKLRQEITSQNIKLVKVEQEMQLHSASLTKSGDELSIAREQLACSEEKIQALEQCKQSLGADLDAMAQTNNKLSKDVEDARSELHSKKLQYEKAAEEHMMKIRSATDEIQFLGSQLNEESKIKASMESEIKSLKQECSQLKEERAQGQGEGGALVALHSALDSLRKRLTKSDSAKARLEREIQELARFKMTQELREAEQDRTVADLKDRLKMCQREYEEQYLEGLKFKKRLKQLEKASTPPPAPRPDEAASLLDSGVQTNTQTNSVRIQAEPSVKTAGNNTTSSAADEETTLSVSELQSQMQSLASELEKRKNKCEQYKRQYREEVSKRKEAERMIREGEQEIVALRNTLAVMRATTGSPSRTPPVSLPRPDVSEFDPLVTREQQNSSSRAEAKSSRAEASSSQSEPMSKEFEPMSQPPPTALGLEVNHIEEGAGGSGRKTVPGNSGNKPAPREQTIQRHADRPSDIPEEPMPSLPNGTCPVCRSMIEDSDTLTRHVNAHFTCVDGQDRVCPMCDRVFKESELDKLQEHCNSHLDEAVE